MPEYFLILICLLIFSSLIHWKYKLKIFISRAHQVSFLLVTYLVGFIWDYVAIQRGHWSFGTAYLTGYRIGPLPLEEWLFFAVFPYALLVLYKVSEKKAGR